MQESKWHLPFLFYYYSGKHSHTQMKFRFELRFHVSALRTKKIIKITLQHTEKKDFNEKPQLL